MQSIACNDISISISMDDSDDDPTSDTDGDEEEEDLDDSGPLSKHKKVETKFENHIFSNFKIQLNKLLNY